MKGIHHGILLKKIDYSETSLIVQFFTLEEGTQSYLFQGGKKKKGNILHALSLTEITFYKREDSDLGKISSISPIYVPQQLPYHPIKSGIVFFMAEVLEKVLRKSPKDEELYFFIAQEIKWLDLSYETTNYPLWFLFKLSFLLGISIQITETSGKIFDLQEGTISNSTPSSPYYLDGQIVQLITILLQSDRNKFLTLSISKMMRRELLTHLIDYYRIHISGFTLLKSVEVLQTIME